MELAGQMGRGGLVFYADLTDSKDQCSWSKAGDLAIKTAALILGRRSEYGCCFPDWRDEFTVLALDTDKQFIPVLRKRMEELQAGENKTLGPWKVSKYRCRTVQSEKRFRETHDLVDMISIRKKLKKKNA